MLYPAFMITLLGVSAFTSGSHRSTPHGDLIIEYLLSVVAGLTYASLYYLHRRHLYMTCIKSALPNLTGKRAVQVCRAGLVLVNREKHGSVRWTWDHLHNIALRKTNLVISTTHPYGVVIPLRCFAGTKRLMEWLQQFSLCSGRSLPCPRCAYDLHGTTDGRCPECGYPEE